MDNMQTSLATIVDKASGNTDGTIMDRFIKPRSSTMFGHSVYSLDGPGTTIAISGPHDDFSTVLSGYGWLGKISDGCFRPIRMQKL